MKKKKNGNKRKEKNGNKRNANFKKDSCQSSVAMVTLTMILKFSHDR